MKLIPKLGKQKNTAITIPVIGIAGSAGKTSIAEIIRHVATVHNTQLSVLDHIGSWHGQHVDSPSRLQMLDKKSLNQFILSAQKGGSQGVIIEVDTEKAAMGVYNDIDFDTLAFASLDFDHGFSTIDEMFKLYTRLTMQIKENGMLIVNQSDPNHSEWLQHVENKLPRNVFAFMVNNENAWSQKFSLTGTSFMLFNSIPIDTKLTGVHTIINAQIAIQILSKFMDMNAIKQGMLSAKNPKGRLDTMHHEPYLVMIDTARQPHMLENSLYYLKNIKAPNARLITVLGSSLENKPLNQKIGDIAHKYVDIGILTSLDPNTASVYNINSNIHSNLEKTNSIMVERFNSSEEFELINKKNFTNRIFNLLNDNAKPFIAFDLNHYTGRLDAIKLATSLAGPGDIVFIAGKGDDLSTIYNNVEYEWSDYEAVRLMSGI